MAEPSDAVRLDRWLWAARFFKSRAQAKKAVEAGHVELNGRRTKPAKEVTPGDALSIRRGFAKSLVVVQAVAEQRRNATFAQTLYEETEESVRARESEAAARRLQRAGLTVPDRKPDRRARQAIKQLKKFKNG
ncbi:MAG: S4 domain-containing protein [Gammaproteobacteria bacterium]|nr:S4 domain-containing protein [Gammaproteobacteria bacterium]